MRARYSVLIVDADRAVRRSLWNLLAVANVDVHLAANGCEALKLLDHQRIDAAVINLMMPRLDGLGVARALLARPEAERPRVVFVVSAQPEVRRYLVGIDVVRVFPNPLDAIDLAGELDRALAGGPPVKATRA